MTPASILGAGVGSGREGPVVSRPDQLGDPANWKSLMDLETQVRCKRLGAGILAWIATKDPTLLGAEGPGVQVTSSRRTHAVRSVGSSRRADDRSSS